MRLFCYIVKKFLQNVVQNYKYCFVCMVNYTRFKEFNATHEQNEKEIVIMNKIVTNKCEMNVRL